MTPKRPADPSAQAQEPRLVASRLERLLDRRLRVAAAIAAAVTAGCADSVRAVADGPTDRATKVEEISDAIATRFTNPERSGQFESTRRKLISGALHPSRVFSDTSLWSSTTNGNTRLLWAYGSLTPRGYRFDIVDHGVLDNLGDTRHAIALHKNADGDYQWTTGVDFAIGSIRARDIGAMLEMFLIAGHGHDGTALRAAAHTAFPRSAAVMSKLFRIDSLSLTPGPQGTALVNLAVGIHTEILKQSAPHFASYLAKYVDDSKYRFLVTDRAGVPYFEVKGANKKLSIQYRVRADGLVSTLGPPRPMPDSLRLVSDLNVPVKLFDVGWHDLTTDFVIGRSERSRSWLFIARTEPQWDLPLVTARLIRTPLRRPFQGAGSTFEIAVIDSSAGGQTILARRARLEVKESAIMRFLSSLVARVFDDLDANVEQEEADFVRELMSAFQQDARVILGR